MKAVIPINPHWQSFSVAKSSRSKVAADWLVNNVTSASMERHSSHRQCIEAICASASRPVPVASVCEELGANFIGPRGNTFFGTLGDQIDGILANYADLGWWITDQGLHIGAIAPANGVASLKKFDRFVGALVEERWCDTLAKANTNLSKIDLEEIVEKVDAEGFVLKENLQPAARDKLAEYNRQNNRYPVRTFAGAIKKPRLIRLIRLRLALARTRYREAAQTNITSPVEAIPRCFWSLSIF